MDAMGRTTWLSQVCRYAASEVAMAELVWTEVRSLAAALNLESKLSTMNTDGSRWVLAIEV